MDLLTPITVALRLYVATWQYIWHLPYDHKLPPKQSTMVMVWCLVHGLLLGGLIALLTWGLTSYAESQSNNPPLAEFRALNPLRTHWSEPRGVRGRPGVSGAILVNPVAAVGGFTGRVGSVGSVAPILVPPVEPDGTVRREMGDKAEDKAAVKKQTRWDRWDEAGRVVLLFLGAVLVLLWTTIGFCRWLARADTQKEALEMEERIKMVTKRAEIEKEGWMRR